MQRGIRVLATKCRRTIGIFMERSLREPEGIDPVLGPDGNLAQDSVKVDLAALWSHLHQARVADELFAQMQLPRFASSKGEESIHAALALRLGSDDWVYPGIRDRALPLLRGADLQDLVAQLRGRSQAETKGRLGNTGTTSHLAAVACPLQALGMHLCLATGHARALKLSQSRAVIVALCGEGLSAHGRFHEALTLAVSAKLPVLFVVKRPIWTREAPVEAGQFGQGVLARARAGGMWALGTDGKDCLAVLAGLDQALEQVRHGQGPALLEVSYAPLHEQSPSEHDPLHRLRTHLERQGLLTSQQEQAQRQALVDQFNATP